jgi:multidrug resistance efflux pump
VPLDLPSPIGGRLLTIEKDEGDTVEEGDVIARLDDVLTMCAWRVFDRERGLLTARLGLGSTESSTEVLAVLDQLGAEGEDRARLHQLWIASQGWW